MYTYWIAYKRYKGEECWDPLDWSLYEYKWHRPSEAIAIAECEESKRTDDPEYPCEYKVVRYDVQTTDIPVK